MSFKPMLACEYDSTKLVYPVIASPKLDGIRASVVGGKLLSRSLKPIPNKHVSGTLCGAAFDGFDGELIVGAATASDVFRTTTSHVMSHDKVFDYTYHVFDHHNAPHLPYTDRLLTLRRQLEITGYPRIVLHQHKFLHSEDDLLEYEAEQLAAGYEGLILRDPNGRYKFGRSTVNEGLLLKVKRFQDSEAVVIGFEEQMKNNNEKTINELGRSKRSSHKDGKSGKDTLGALVVRDMTTGLEFNIGTGLNDEIRSTIWETRGACLGQTVKYKYFPVGVKELPRHPVFISFRDARDL